ncbi:MAG: HD domain-containing protein [Firmicutes bacterium]|nr:HD domain-containing protein [Bacillota bacterium]
MENRLITMQGMLLDEIDKYAEQIPARDATPIYEKVHAIGSGKIGYLLALQRGADPELAAAACSVHDYGRIVTGKQDGHAKAGYGPVKEFLRGTGLYSEEEIETIAVAVRNHSSKSEVGTPIEEIVKDADVLDFHQCGYQMPREEQQKRLDAMLAAGWDGRSTE